MQNDADHWDEFGRLKWEMQYPSESALRKEIAELTERMNNAPEAFEESASAQAFLSGEAELSLPNLMAGTPPYSLDLYATKDDAHISSLHCSTLGFSCRRDQQNKAHPLLPSEQTDIIGKLQLPMADAFAKAEEIVQALGISGLVCNHRAGMISEYKDWNAYVFNYERAAANTPVTFVNGHTPLGGGGGVRPPRHHR